MAKEPKTSKDWLKVAKNERKSAALCFFSFSRQYALKKAEEAEIKAAELQAIGK